MAADRPFGFLFAASLLSLFAAQLPSWLHAFPGRTARPRFFARALRSARVFSDVRVRVNVYVEV